MKRGPAIHETEDNDEEPVVYPANLVLEAHDQHSRWFLTSLVTSVALTGHAPYKNLKTLGLFLNERGDPMSFNHETSKDLKIDPTDLISGSVKMDGERKHGFGLDVMRAWAITQDSDTSSYLIMDDVQSVN